MNTDYKIVSPYQFKRKMPNIQNDNHPVQEFVRQNCLGSYSLTATFLPDEHTLQTLKIPGMAAFLCVLRCGEQVLAEGRSMTVVSEMNKFYEKSLIYAKGQSLLDAIAKGSKILDLIQTNSSPQQSTPPSFNQKERGMTGGITDKQKNYLLQLLKSNQASEEEIEEVYKLSKEEAADKISFLAPSR